jgi:hypothetical protein
MNARMLRKTQMRQAAAFVISRDDENRYALIRDALQRLECLICKTWNDA